MSPAAKETRLLLTAPEAAQRLGMSYMWVHRRADAGLLHVYAITAKGQRLYHPRDVEREVRRITVARRQGRRP